MKDQLTHNSSLAKKRVQWLNEGLCFVSSLALAESSVLRNPLLRKAANSYAAALKTTFKQQTNLT